MMLGLNAMVMMTAKLLQSMFQTALGTDFAVVKLDAGFLRLFNCMTEASEVWCVRKLGR